MAGSSQSSPICSCSPDYGPLHKNLGRGCSIRGGGGGLTTSTRTFMRHSMLVLLRVVLPLFCISFVSGPGNQAGRAVHLGEGQGSACLETLQRGRGASKTRGQAGVCTREAPRIVSCSEQQVRALREAGGGSRMLCPTCKDDQSKAPLGVPDGAAPQQHPLVVQGIFLPLHGEGPCKPVQLVIGGFTPDLTCGQAKGTCEWTAASPRLDWFLCPPPATSSCPLSPTGWESTSRGARCPPQGCPTFTPPLRLGGRGAGLRPRGHLDAGFAGPLDQDHSPSQHHPEPSPAPTTREKAAVPKGHRLHASGGG